MLNIHFFMKSHNYESCHGSDQFLSFHELSRSLSQEFRGLWVRALFSLGIFTSS